MAKTIEMHSPAFAASSRIPVKHTGQGEDVSPPLKWGAVPEETRSLALICDDPDAPMGEWTHWVIFNIPAGTEELPAAVPAIETLPNGARQGTNDFGRIGYGGPFPPTGASHRYFFKIFALDAALALVSGGKRADLLRAMEGHVLGQGQLMGTYRRQ